MESREASSFVPIQNPDEQHQGPKVSDSTSQLPRKGPLEEQMVWDELMTIYDPEIPVNIVDLGLIYSAKIEQLGQGGNRIEVRMSLTAPGCGMAEVLKSTAESKLSQLPDVSEVRVDIVLDPPWHPGLMSEAAKLQLGL
jgi:metal-sulfur cluster biosynthetic enzyme